MLMNCVMSLTDAEAYSHRRPCRMLPIGPGGPVQLNYHGRPPARGCQNVSERQQFQSNGPVEWPGYNGDGGSVDVMLWAYIVCKFNASSLNVLVSTPLDLMLVLQHYNYYKPSNKCITIW